MGFMTSNGRVLSRRMCGEGRSPENEARRAPSGANNDKKTPFLSTSALIGALV